MTTQSSALKKQTPSPEISQKKSNTAVIVLIIVIILLIILGVGGFFVLAFLGAKGQPGTILKPSNVKTPQTLTATEVDASVVLNWKKSASVDVTKYNVYKSQTSGSNFQKLKTLETISNLSYIDNDISSGNTYYYIVTGVSANGTESGNSNQAVISTVQDPLLPNGVQNWSDVLVKYDSDSKYAILFGQVTGLSRSDIEKYIALENQGKNLKKKLLAESIITNTSESYKILPNYVLEEDKWFLTDEYSIPRVMIWCGNPVKLIQEMTSWGQFVASMQTTAYSIIYVFPVSVTNTIVYAGESVNDMVSTVVGDSWGPGFYTPDHAQDYPEATPSPTYSVGTTPSPTPTAAASPSPTSTADLEEGEQWALEGQILVKATPADPEEYEDVTITVTLVPAGGGENVSGVNINYHVVGTDEYMDDGVLETDENGQIEFYIPGGEAGVKDTITVEVEDLGLEGSTEYIF